MIVQADPKANLSAVRKRSALFEEALGSERRKRLGQFFTGFPLSRVLAALSCDQNCASVLDPMAGHGDLLDSVLERCSTYNGNLERVDAIEIDPDVSNLCEERINVWKNKYPNAIFSIHKSTAFDSDLINTLPNFGYDLVITNPPYVRYQTISSNGRETHEHSLKSIRNNLLQIVSKRVPPREQKVWIEIIKGFSGLSDLSVPSWILSALLVKENGTLALVAPATWRTRDYADVLQYLLARCFQLKIVVTDRQPGWFSEALVRTNLIVAKRLPSKNVLTSLFSRPKSHHKVIWIEIDPIAKEHNSLVGAAFGPSDPEGKFAEFLRGCNRSSLESKGIIVNERDEDNISNILSVQRRSPWLRNLETFNDMGPLFKNSNSFSSQWIPSPLKDLLPHWHAINTCNLNHIGIQVSQGLRTGCNGFFYVDLIKKLNEKTALILTNDLIGGTEAEIPVDAIYPVIRRQSELSGFSNGSMLNGYVLDLRGYVLPEDLHYVTKSHDLYRSLRIKPPKVMPDSLAELVRRASHTKYNSIKGNKVIPKLTAVRTNARVNNGTNGTLPRFWYMLPDFKPRHIPDAFVPRINQDTPKFWPNPKPAFLIDANFSTLWADNKLWTPEGIACFLNSTWSRACMETVGTPMGGGALKLEATHLRRLPLPRLSVAEIKQISKIALNIYTAPSEDDKTEIDRIVTSSIFKKSNSIEQIDTFICNLNSLTNHFKESRQRC